MKIPGRFVLLFTLLLGLGACGSNGIARLSQATDIGLRLRAEGPYTLFEDEIRFGADSRDYACTKYGVEQSSYEWVLKDGQLRPDCD